MHQIFIFQYDYSATFMKTSRKIKPSNAEIKGNGNTQCICVNQIIHFIYTVGKSI